jgi:hypothetical protein
VHVDVAEDRRVVQSPRIHVGQEIGAADGAAATWISMTNVKSGVTTSARGAASGMGVVDVMD